MGLGVLEDKRTPFPPGTVLLEDRFRAIAALDGTRPEHSHLKKKGDIVLQPQPSDSPNDPLNFPQKLKNTIITIIIVVMVTMGGTAAMLNTGIRILAEQFHMTYPDLLASLTPPAIISGAIGLLFCSALAAVYGKRVQFVIAIVVLWFNLLAGYFANSLNYYKTLSIVGGIFGAPIELLLNPIITDLVYVHQRGRLMALSSVVTVIGGDVASIVSGNVIAFLGIKYLYIISFAIVAPMVILVYLFVWETTYTRPIPSAVPMSPVSPSTSEGKDDVFESKDSKKPTVIMTESTEESMYRTETNYPHDMAAAEPPIPYKERLKVFRGRVTNRSFIKALWAPFPLMIFPSNLFSTIVNGAFLTWMVTAGVIAGQVLLYPPYNLRPDTLAYIGLPGSAAAFLAAVVAGFLSDWSIKKLSMMNKGVYEPEFRLLMMIPATLFSTLGFFLIGPAYARYADIKEIVGLGLLFYLSGPFASAACIPYIFDTQEKNTTEAMVATSLCKMLFIFFATKYVPTWYYQVGPLHAFNTLGYLNLACASLTIPMYIFGKRARGAVSRNKFLMKATVVQ